MLISEFQCGNQWKFTSEQNFTSNAQINSEYCLSSAWIAECLPLHLKMEPESAAASHTIQCHQCPCPVTVTQPPLARNEGGSWSGWDKRGRELKVNNGQLERLQLKYWATSFRFVVLPYSDSKTNTSVTIFYNPKEKKNQYFAEKYWSVQLFSDRN